jgi:hypothetical protein
MIWLSGYVVDVRWLMACGACFASAATVAVPHACWYTPVFSLGFAPGMCIGSLGRPLSSFFQYLTTWWETRQLTGNSWRAADDSRQQLVTAWWEMSAPWHQLATAWWEMSAPWYQLATAWCEMSAP